MPTQETAPDNQDLVQRKSDLLSSTIDGQVVIVALEQNNYIGLEGAANRIWALLAEPTSISKISEVLVREYDVSLEQCTEDVCTFLAKLQHHGLLE